MDIQEIWKQTQILQHTAPDNTSWGPEEIWTKVTSWFTQLDLVETSVYNCHHNDCYVRFSLLVETHYGIKQRTYIKRRVPPGNFVSRKGGTS